MENEPFRQILGHFARLGPNFEWSEKSNLFELGGGWVPILESVLTSTGEINFKISIWPKSAWKRTVCHPTVS